MVILILLGLKHLIGSEVVVSTLAIAGGTALILIGINGFLKADKKKLDLNSKVRLSSGLVAGGVFFTAFNPTFPAWWVSVGAALLSRALLAGLFGVVMFLLGHWLADIVWYSLVSFVVTRGKSWLNERRYQLTLKALGIIMAGIGTLIIFQVI
jgi:threonine/homoserine/homoserine lactone efflux protein